MPSPASARGVLQHAVLTFSLTLASEMSSPASYAEGLPSSSFNTLKILPRLSIRLQPCNIFSIFLCFFLFLTVWLGCVCGADLHHPLTCGDLYLLSDQQLPSNLPKMSKREKKTVDQVLSLFSLTNKQHEKKSHLSRSFAHTCFCFPPIFRTLLSTFISANTGPTPGCPSPTVGVWTNWRSGRSTWRKFGFQTPFLPMRRSPIFTRPRPLMRCSESPTKAKCYGVSGKTVRSRAALNFLTIPPSLPPPRSIPFLLGQSSDLYDVFKRLSSSNFIQGFNICCWDVCNVLITIYSLLHQAYCFISL